MAWERAVRATGHPKSRPGAAPTRATPNTCGRAPCARQVIPSRGQGPLPQGQPPTLVGARRARDRSSQVAARGRSHKGNPQHLWARAVRATGHLKSRLGAAPTRATPNTCGSAPCTRGHPKLRPESAPAEESQGSIAFAAQLAPHPRQNSQASQPHMACSDVQRQPG